MQIVPIQIRFLIYLFFITSISIFSYNLEDGKDLYNSGVQGYQSGNYNKAFNDLNNSINIFKELKGNNEDFLLNSYLWLGATSFQLGRSDDAENNYLLSLELSKKLGNREFESNTISALGNLKYSLGDYHSAADWFLKNSELLNSLGYALESKSALEFSAYCRLLGKDYLKAKLIYQKLLSNTSNSENYEIATLYGFLGNTQYYLGELNDSVLSYEYSVKLLESYTPTIDLSRYRAWLGKIYMELGNKILAISNFDSALEISRDLESIEDESRILASLGLFHSTVGEYKKAVTLYKESLELAIRLKNEDFTISAYESLEWIYNIDNDLENLINVKTELLKLYKDNNNFEKLGINFNEIGELEYKLGKYENSIHSFNSAKDIFLELNDKENLSISLLNLGIAYYRTGNNKLSNIFLNKSLELKVNEDDFTIFNTVLGLYDYKIQIDIFNKLLDYYLTIDDITTLTYLYNNIGILYYNISEYDKAISYYKKAVELSSKREDNNSLAINYHNIAQAKSALSFFDEALEFNQLALEVAQDNSLKKLEGYLLNSLGEVYRAWGWYEKSLSYYYSAESILNYLEDIEGLSSVYNNIGQALRLSGNPNLAINYYQNALKISETLGDKKSEAINLSNLGESYRAINDFTTALNYYQKALSMDIEINNLQGIQIRKNNIALLDLEAERYDAALETFKEGLGYWRKIGNRQQEATALKNLWSVYFSIGDYESGADVLTQVVNIQEELRLTAKGSVRREFLESQVSSYRDLAVTYYYLNDPMNSLYYMELSRGKYLLDQMSVDSDDNYNWRSYIDYINGLDSDELLITFSISDINIIQGISVSNRSVSTTLIKIDDEFLDSFINNYDALITRYVEGASDDKLSKVLKLYRVLLSRPIQTRTTANAITEISEYLYKKLISPFSKELDGKKELIIVPDGILGTIPFEVLQVEGTYLIENFDISYSQSLVISQFIKDRKYSGARESMLAFGGAIYETNNATNYNDSMNIDTIRSEVIELLRTGSDTRKAYEGMGLNRWLNLPGTLDEVNKLSEIINNSKVITGSDATEEVVFNLSKSGDLSNYKALHFATHGIVVPDIPEMSAVVLSLDGEASGSMDGYLTMSEIVNLNINADFVNLSACETGLGKIYQGEGVVGLTQAFLIAGANSLSVSLWQVSDESTAQFMVGVYSLVEDQGYSYSSAISEMKRVFLRDSKYSSSYFWAPFVLYGDNKAGL